MKKMGRNGLFILSALVAVNYSVSINRIRRGGNAVLGQGEMPSIIKQVGDDPTNSFTLEEPPDHKSLVVGITVVIAFVFAIAGVFIGVYFRIERFLRCIDRIGGSSEMEDPLIDDAKSIISGHAMSTLIKQNETGFVHSCPAEAYPMKKQIYEKAHRTPHVARRTIGPDLPQADPLMIATPTTSRRKREGSITGDTMSLSSFKSESGRSIRSMFSARSIGAKSFGSMFSHASKDSKSSSVLRNKINMYRKMRQDRKKFKDDNSDTQSVLSEARSHRSMVIDGSSRQRHRGRTKSTTEEHTGDAAGSNFGNRSVQSDLISLSSRKSTASRVSKVSRRSTTSTSSKKSSISLKSLRSKKAKEDATAAEFLNFGSYVAQEYIGPDKDEPKNNASDMLF